MPWLTWGEISESVRIKPQIKGLDRVNKEYLAGAWREIGAKRRDFEVFINHQEKVKVGTSGVELLFDIDRVLKVLLSRFGIKCFLCGKREQGHSSRDVFHSRACWACSTMARGNQKWALGPPVLSEHFRLASYARALLNKKLKTKQGEPCQTQ